MSSTKLFSDNKGKAFILPAAYLTAFAAGAFHGLFANRVLAAGALSMAAVSLLLFVRCTEGSITKRMKAVLLSLAGTLFLLTALCGSRAAVLSAVVGALVSYSDVLKTEFRKNRWVLPAILVVLAAVCLGMYYLRPESVQARLLIWRVSMDLIAGNPVTGLGPDGFRQHYMLEQAAYFAANPESLFVPVAGNAAFPFNDLVRLAVERGILLTTAFIACIIFTICRTEDKKRLGLLFSYCTFACFSYPGYCFGLFLVFPLSLTGSITRKDWFSLTAIAASILISFSLPAGLRSVHPNYDWWIEKAEASIQNGDSDEAEKILIEAGNMIPTMVKPDYLLWKLYRNRGDIGNAESRAVRALTKKTKVLGTRAIRARREILDIEGDDFLYCKFIKDNLQHHRGWNDIAVIPEMEEYFKWVADNWEHNKDSEWKRKAGAEWDALASKELFLSHTDSLDLEKLEKNVDQAKKEWSQGPYSKDLNEDDFKEMLLPFVTTSEWMQTDKAWVREYFAPILGIDRGASTREAVANFRDWIAGCRNLTSRITVEKTNLGIFEMMLPTQTFDCHYIASVSCDIFRACGIPAVMEFTPKWPDRARGHFWCAVPDTNGVLSPFSPPYKGIMDDWDPYLQGAGKIYRLNWSEQKEAPTFLAAPREYLPPRFENPLISDQTWRYHRTVDLTIPFRFETDSNLAWLCFFSVSGTGLAPVAWGKIDKKRHRVTFEQIPADVVFFPVFYDDGEIAPFAPPFYVDGKGAARKAQRPMSTKMGEPRKVVKTTRIKEYKLADETQSMLLSRKYPDKSRLRTFRHQMPGTCILGADTKEGPFDTIGTIMSAPGPYLQDIALSCNDKKFRYFKLCSPNKKYLNIGHIELLCAPRDCTEGATPPSALPIFSPEEAETATPDTLLRIRLFPASNGAGKVLDDNLETYTVATEILLDAGTPVKAKVLRFAPRNACNIVVPGDTYALYYYDLGWQFHSRQVAGYNFVEFDGVPKGTLYRLANETEGAEELPFAYEKGEQKFINNYNPERITN